MAGKKQDKAAAPKADESKAPVDEPAKAPKVPAGDLADKIARSRRP